MKIGLIDVDGHNYPNLALMQLSSWHKSQGDTVEWWWGWDHYDIVYMSKVFSNTYTPDMHTPANADKVIRGGGGYAIKTIHGIEVYDKALDPDLPDVVQHMMPDYSIYPQYAKDTAYGRLTEGCPKQCTWCHVCKMQGTAAVKRRDLSEFWNGQKEIVLLDPNILACTERDNLLRQLIKSKAYIDFNQGLDIQRMDSDVCSMMNRMKIKSYHFAWDDPAVDLTDQFAMVGEQLRLKRAASRMVYVLTNYAGSTLDDALGRIYILRSLRFNPYVMIYDKPNAPEWLLRLQRWCNNKIIFGACKFFEDYEGGNT